MSTDKAGDHASADTDENRPGSLDTDDDSCTPRALRTRRDGGPVMEIYGSNGLAWHPVRGGLSWGGIPCGGSDGGWCGPLDNFPFPGGPVWSVWPRGPASCVVAEGGRLICHPESSGTGATYLPAAGLLEVLSLYSSVVCVLTTGNELQCRNQESAPWSTRIDAPVVTASAASSLRPDATPHGCGLTEDGVAHCFGDARLAAFEQRDACWRELDLGEPFGTIACGIDGAGQASCVDMTPSGAQAPDSFTPPPPGPLHALTVDGGHACALDAADHVVCWGAWGPGESERDRDDAPQDEAFVALSIFGGVGCGMRADGAIRCWGEQTPVVTDAPADP